MGKIFWSAAPLPGKEQIPSLLAYLEKSFPRRENGPYFDRLMGNGDRCLPPRVVLARLSALSLLPPMLVMAGIQSSVMVLSRDQNGRPHGQTVTGNPVPFDFNLSHSDAHVACALLVGNGRVGVDVEELVPPSRALRLIQRYCTEGEKQMLAVQNDEEKTKAFTRLWTMREAISKQDGRGNPLRFDASLVPNSVRVFCASFPHTGTHISICAPMECSLKDLVQASAFPEISWDISDGYSIRMESE